MRTIQDLKAMAKSLRDDLAAKKLPLGHSECLELVAHQFGFPDWNTLSSKFDATGYGPASLGVLADVEGAPAVDAKRVDDRYLLVPRRPSQSVDVVYLVNLLRDKRSIATLCVAGKFGQVSSIEIESLLRVSCIADAPDEGGRSLTTVTMSVFSDNGWTTPEKMSGGFELSGAPGFSNSFSATPFRVEIRPRRVIWGTARPN